MDNSKLVFRSGTESIPWSKRNVQSSKLPPILTTGLQMEPFATTRPRFSTAIVKANSGWAFRITAIFKVPRFSFFFSEVYCRSLRESPPAGFVQKPHVQTDEEHVPARPDAALFNRFLSSKIARAGLGNRGFSFRLFQTLTQVFTQFAEPIARGHGQVHRSTVIHA